MPGGLRDEGNSEDGLEDGLVEERADCAFVEVKTKKKKKFGGVSSPSKGLGRGRNVGGKGAKTSNRASKAQ